MTPPETTAQVAPAPETKPRDQKDFETPLGTFRLRAPDRPTLLALLARMGELLGSNASEMMRARGQAMTWAYTQAMLEICCTVKPIGWEDETQYDWEPLEALLQEWLTWQATFRAAVAAYKRTHRS